MGESTSTARGTSRLGSIGFANCVQLRFGIGQLGLQAIIEFNGAPGFGLERRRWVVRISVVNEFRERVVRLQRGQRVLLSDRLRVVQYRHYSRAYGALCRRIHRSR